MHGIGEQGQLIEEARVGELDVGGVAQHHGAEVARRRRGVRPGQYQIRMLRQQLLVTTLEPAEALGARAP